MKKAVISVFVVLAMVLNIFGFGVLQARSSAEGVAVVIAYTLLSCLAGYLSSVAAGLSGQVAAAIPEAVKTHINNEAIKNGDVIEVYQSGNNPPFLKPVSGLDSDTAEFASFLCDYLNSSSHWDTIIAGFMLENGDNSQNLYHPEVKAEVYEEFKTEAVNAFTAYLELKKHQVNINNYSDAMNELAAALGHEWDPTYSFSFVGPLTPVQLSDVNSIHSLDINGVHFYVPIRIQDLSNSGWPTRQFCETLGAVVQWVQVSPNGCYATFTTQGWGGNCYILYDGDLYISTLNGHRRTIYQGETITIEGLQKGNLHFYALSDHHSLDSEISSIDELIGCYMGVFVWTSAGNGEYYPELASIPKEDDFIDIISGDTLNPGKTDDESTIGSAISLGLISDDPTLEFDDQGNIISADGISLATLENLVQELIDKTYSFESFEEYLQTITQLLQAGNVNTDQIDDIRSALRAWEASQSDALDTLNENVATIADALTATYEVEDDHEEMDIYNVEHGGLSEAVTIVDTAMPFVAQMKQLVLNLFDSNNFNGVPPNFHFYADLDHDGVNERYNAFDLSFLETRLTNDNLEDKGILSTPITVRDFFQQILVLIIYVIFAIKFLKKLPSLINGSTSDESNVTIMKGR